MSFSQRVTRQPPLVFQTHNQAAKVAESSVPETMVAVGENGAHVSFEDWVVSADTEDNSTIVAAVTTLGISVSEGSISHEHTCVKRVDQIRSQNVCNVLHTTYGDFMAF